MPSFTRLPRWASLDFSSPPPGGLGPCAFVAVLFATHPLHAESVAWIAERKDVLSACFWFLALWSYVRQHYWLTLLAFCLGLMAKPMVVTLPFVLFLLDAWPLRQSLRTALRVKIPMLVLSAASAIATYLIQGTSGAFREAVHISIGLRIENAVVSYATYILKVFWPSGLAVFYPYPHGLPVWQIVVSVVLLLGISMAALWQWHSRPYLAVGWLWYLGTLVPVIGLVQVGSQARADRYTYLPMVGLTIMLAWGLSEILKSKVAIPGTIIAGLACVVLCEGQLQYWRNSETLFRHALDVTNGNYVAHHNLGTALADEGLFHEAIMQYQAALHHRTQRRQRANRLRKCISKIRTHSGGDPALSCGAASASRFAYYTQRSGQRLSGGTRGRAGGDRRVSNRIASQARL